MDSLVVNSVKLSFLSIPENVALARGVMASFSTQLDLTVSDLEELKVAISEAVSNAIIHGYQNMGDQIVELDAILYKDRLEISVIDTGVGIRDVNEAMKPAFSTVSDRMGLGFAFMQSFMDDLQVSSEPNKGTRVTMIKMLVPYMGS